MRSYKIEDVKSFMSALLLHDAFDGFDVVEGDIVTFISTHIDGRFHKEYFDTADAGDDPENPSAPLYASWKQIQPHVYDMVRGKHTPLKIRLVLRLSDKNSSGFISSFSIDPDMLAGLFLNILYENGTVTLTSGISLRIFTTDKSAEHSWDDTAQELLQGAGLPFTSL